MIATDLEIIEIEDAKYLGNYKIRLKFNNTKTRVIDFESFLSNAKNPMTVKYRKKDLFQNFIIEYGDLIWGDYEMCFPIADLYAGKI